MTKWGTICYRNNYITKNRCSEPAPHRKKEKKLFLFNRKKSQPNPDFSVQHFTWALRVRVKNGGDSQGQGKGTNLPIAFDVTKKRKKVLC